MSATLGGGLGERLVALMSGGGGGEEGGGEGGREVPLLASEGRCFPVRVAHVGGPPRRGERHAMETLAAATVMDALASEEGDVLCFLPGVGEIDTVARLLRESGVETRHRVRVLPLHGSLSPAAQDKALRRDAHSDRRRVVLATPIAESSVTIEGVRIVVDSGLRRARCPAPPLPRRQRAPALPPHAVALQR